MIRTSGRQCAQPVERRGPTRASTRAARDEAARHPLMLQAQHHDHVGVRDGLLQPVADLHAQLLGRRAGSGSAARATVTVMPILRMPWMLERATRLWVMSPTMVTLSPSRCPCVLADRQEVEQRLGRVLVRAVAGVDDRAREVPGEERAAARRLVAHHDHVRAHGLDVLARCRRSSRPSPRSSREAEKLMTSAESHLPAISKEVRVRVEAS